MNLWGFWFHILPVYQSSIGSIIPKAHHVVGIFFRSKLSYLSQYITLYNRYEILFIAFLQAIIFGAWMMPIRDWEGVSSIKMLEIVRLR